MRHTPILAAAKARDTEIVADHDGSRRKRDVRDGRSCQTGGAGATNVPTGLIADARKVSPTQFLAVALDRLFPAPPPTRESEQAAAARRFINAAWASDDVPALRAAYLREKDAIDARWMHQDAMRSEVRL